ncbi:MAG TPA: DUF3943 domain-containing protein, partial [Prevotella sp.]
MMLTRAVIAVAFCFAIAIGSRAQGVSNGDALCMPAPADTLACPQMAVVHGDTCSHACAHPTTHFVHINGQDSVPEYKKCKRHLYASALPTSCESSEIPDSIALWNNGRKSYWASMAETVGINVMINVADRIVLNEPFSKVTFKVIARNWRDGLVWDNDKFHTNLFAHPYHGSLYYSAARSLGLNFWQSAAYALGGSLMWEYGGEVEPPAINDLVSTTVGGIAMGEVTHRISELILNNGDRGWRRVLREVVAMAVNPMGGLNRILTGDAWRVRPRAPYYYDRNRVPVDFAVSAGLRYMSDDDGRLRHEFNPYLNIALEYGNALGDTNRHPYDFFNMEGTFSLLPNQPFVSSFHLLGRIWGKAMECGKSNMEVGFYQFFDYYDSEQLKNNAKSTLYRYSEAAAFGPGIIIQFPESGVFGKLEQRLFLSGILLGGAKSDYYHFSVRDYNMGSGLSVKAKTHMEFRRWGRLVLRAGYSRIFTWRGYEDKDYTHIDTVYLNA